MSKQELCEKISALTLSYSDFIFISEILENPNKRDKTTYKKIHGKIESSLIRKACENIKSSLQSNCEGVVISSNGKDSTTLSVTYVEQDFSKTELRQRTLKKLEIHIENKNNELTFKLPANDKAIEISNKIKALIKADCSNINDSELIEKEISLENINAAEKRSEFFVSLATGINNMDFDGATSVDVYHINGSSELLEDEDEDENFDHKIASYITKAILSGNGVLNSKEFIQLSGNGFYISKLVFTATVQGVEEPKVEFEVGFSDQKNCKNITYAVRGVYDFSQRNSGHNITRRNPTALENNKYIDKLRLAAENSYEKIKG